MFIKLFQKAILYTKEFQEIGLFALMADLPAFTAFAGTPIYYVVLPFLAVLLTLLAVINGYQLLTTSNKNFDQWLAFIVSSVSATLSSISLYGSVLAQAYNFNFVTGPWFFFSSVALAFMQQLTMLGLNLYRAYESRKNSIQRMHYVQAALNNLFNGGLLLAIIGAVAFVMLFPLAAPAVGSYCAIAAVGFTSTSILWRVIPYTWKQVIKEFLQLGKPQEESYERANYPSILQYASICSLNMEQKYGRLFTAIDYNAALKGIELKKAEAQLQVIIIRKINTLTQSLQASEKNIQKIEVLRQLQTAISQHVTPSKDTVFKQYPLAFQNFRAEKGEVEQLFDAVLALDERYNSLNLQALGQGTKSAPLSLT